MGGPVIEKWMYLWSHAEWQQFISACKKTRPEDIALKPPTGGQLGYLSRLKAPSAVACQFTRFEAARVIERRLREDQEYQQWRIRKQQRPPQFG
jgi:hypothetical protein